MMTKSAYKLETLKTRIDHLIKLHRACEVASNDFKDAIKHTAEDAGLDAATVSKYIKARAGEKFESTRDKAIQLAIVFDEVGD